MRTLAAILTLLAATGCGSYADFRLPAPESSGPAGPFVWEARPDPVIPRGAARDVLNPSVVRFRGAYWNLYSEFDGAAWHTAAATSPDGETWQLLGRVLSPRAAEGAYIAANGSALELDGELYYWFETGYPLRIALARSRDGRHWERTPPVLSTGPYGSFDEIAVADPYVIRAAGAFFMFYLGQDRAARQRLGLARSHDGVRWEKLRANPILEGRDGAFDEELGEPAVWSSGGWWWMLYTGRARDERRRLGLARSRDGLAWERVESFVLSGAHPWNSQVLCDPAVELLPEGTVRVWFGGGDLARPDENLNGQIGLGWLRPAR